MQALQGSLLQATRYRELWKTSAPVAATCDAQPMVNTAPYVTFDTKPYDMIAPKPSSCNRCLSIGPPKIQFRAFWTKFRGFCLAECWGSDPSLGTA